MEHIEWLEATTDSDSTREISRRTGVAARTVANQVSRKHFSAENVILIAQGYDKSPVRALVDTGYLEEKWATSVDPETAVWQLSEDQIADHVLQRMKLPGAHDAFETPVDELSERRSMSTTPDVEDMPEDAVADSSADHPEEDNEFD